MILESDKLICLGSEDDFTKNEGAVLPPIVQASLSQKLTVEELAHGLKHEDEEFVYSRGTNPTVSVFENRLAALERGEKCKAFGSGMGAISSVFFGLLKQGDHILFLNQIYGPTLQLAERLENFGITHTKLFGDEVADFREHVAENTKLIYFESPGTMLFRLVPIQEITEFARKNGLLTCIDNSVSTPLFQKPLDMGVDITLHSCTKYIGGHSDVVGGAVVTNGELMKKIFFNAYMLLGSMQAPHDAWLLLRGLLSLPSRLEQQEADCLAVAEFLTTQSRITAVNHPARSEPDAGLFKLQMTGYSGLFSVHVDAKDFAELAGIADRLRYFKKAVSWGGVESLVIPAMGFDGGFDSQRIPWNTLRFSIGLEGAETLIEDLRQALE